MYIGENMNYKEKAHKLVEISKQRGLIKNYCDWCKTEEAKEYAISEEEIRHYTIHQLKKLGIDVEEKNISSEKINSIISSAEKYKEALNKLSKN